MSTPSKNLRLIGLTGGVGSGKSLAAETFKKNGIPVIDLDQIGRDLETKQPELIATISQLLGEDLNTNGRLNRKRVREIVFADKSKRLALEELLHPLIWKEFESKASRLEKQGHKLILCEAALFIEHGHAKKFPELVVVMADENIRKGRVKARDHCSDAVIDQILKSQTTDELRKQLATHLLENSGTPAQLDAQIKELVKTLKSV